eukprot:scaffold3297_cov327-Prasinococcus_capsulatus_cf.AAC.4
MTSPGARASPTYTLPRCLDCRTTLRGAQTARTRTQTASCKRPRPRPAREGRRSGAAGAAAGRWLSWAPTWRSSRRGGPSCCCCSARRATPSPSVRTITTPPPAPRAVLVWSPLPALLVVGVDSGQALPQASTQACTLTHAARGCRTLARAQGRTATGAPRGRVTPSSCAAPTLSLVPSPPSRASWARDLAASRSTAWAAASCGATAAAAIASWSLWLGAEGLSWLLMSHRRGRARVQGAVAVRRDERGGRGGVHRGLPHALEGGLLRGSLRRRAARLRLPGGSHPHGRLCRGCFAHGACASDNGTVVPLSSSPSLLSLCTGRAPSTRRRSGRCRWVCEAWAWR